jgi:hypothetical protein
MHLLDPIHENPAIDAISTRTVLAKIMTLDEKHDCGVELFMTVHNAQEISGISLCKYLRRYEMLRT